MKTSIHLSCFMCGVDVQFSQHLLREYPSSLYIIVTVSLWPCSVWPCASIWISFWRFLHLSLGPLFCCCGGGVFHVQLNLCWSCMCESSATLAECLDWLCIEEESPWQSTWVSLGRILKPWLMRLILLWTCLFIHFKRPASFLEKLILLLFFFAHIHCFLSLALLQLTILLFLYSVAEQTSKLYLLLLVPN